MGVANAFNLIDGLIAVVEWSPVYYCICMYGICMNIEQYTAKHSIRTMQRKTKTA